MKFHETNGIGFVLTLFFVCAQLEQFSSTCLLGQISHGADVSWAPEGTVYSVFQKKLFRMFFVCLFTLCPCWVAVWLLVCLLCCCCPLVCVPLCIRPRTPENREPTCRTLIFTTQPKEYHHSLALCPCWVAVWLLVCLLCCCCPLVCVPLCIRPRTPENREPTCRTLIFTTQPKEYHHSLAYLSLSQSPGRSYKYN